MKLCCVQDCAHFQLLFTVHNWSDICKTRVLRVNKQSRFGPSSPVDGPVDLIVLVLQTKNQESRPLQLATYSSRL